MTDDRLMTVRGRSQLRIQRRFAHPIDSVWRAVTRPAELSAWFPCPVDLDLRVGGAVTFDMGDADVGADASHGEVLELDPPRLLAFSWADDRLAFQLTPDGEGTVLVLTHTFDDRAGAASYATGWDQCLAGLRHVLVDEQVPPPDRGVERHEQLVAQFGLDRGAVTGSGGRWTVRFERQLTCPADVAWDLFLGVDPATGVQRTAPGVGSPLTPYAAPELVLGTVTEVDPPRLLAIDVAPGEPGDRLRLEFVAGTGHGARLVLTVSGSTDRPDERDAAYDQWGRGAVEQVAAEALAWAVSASNTVT
jgi:uncharacterized protein YndB with AHSA1/START domain